MKVLVVNESTYGSTREIAEAVTEELRQSGHAALVSDAADAPAPDGYGAVVIGSGLYMGRWLPGATRYLEEHAGALRRLQVWLFSSGPLGHDDPQPSGESPHAAELAASVGAREHATFAGRLDRSRLRWAHRLIVGAMKAPVGDFRDWEMVRAWAGSIAVALASAEPGAATERGELGAASSAYAEPRVASVPADVAATTAARGA